MQFQILPYQSHCRATASVAKFRTPSASFTVPKAAKHCRTPKHGRKFDTLYVRLPLGVRRCCAAFEVRSEEHTSELQSLRHLVCRLLLEKKKKTTHITIDL